MLKNIYKKNTKTINQNGSYSVSGIQDQIEWIKKHEKLLTNPPIHIYIIRLKNRLVLKVKDEYKLDLRIHKRTNLFDRAKNIIDEMKSREYVTSFEVV